MLGLGKSDRLITIDRHEILAAETPKPDEVISEDYVSYIFFLFPNQKWVRKCDPRILKELNMEFREFGDAIGNNHLAIWFIDENGRPDTNRSLDFVRLFDLDVNSGPYIVYLSPSSPIIDIKPILHHATAATEIKMSKQDLEKIVHHDDLIDMFIIDFNNLGSNYTSNLLNILKGQLRGDDVDLSELEWGKNKCIVKLISKKMGKVAYKIVSGIKEIELTTDSIRIEFHPPETKLSGEYVIQ
ncbi:MAG: hypothetical protein PF482_20230 [Desulfobacteraceae bacterium]|nr:hypothetical protein [Desulfobacteraceae bacterium]